MQETSTNSASRVFLLIAVVLGVLAATIAFLYLNSATASDRTPKIRVVVAQRDLPANTVLDPDKDLRTELIPDTVEMRNLAERSLKPENLAQYKNAKIHRAIHAGTFVFGSDLMAAADINLVGDRRALGIKVKGAAALAGVVVPGDYVKIYSVRKSVHVRALATRPSSDNVAGNMVEAQAWEAIPAIDEPVKILAVGSRLSRSRQQFPGMSGPMDSSGESEAQQSIIVECTEEQARTILEETSVGTIQLILCPPPQAVPANP